jgi:hypothetical protein
VFEWHRLPHVSASREDGWGLAICVQLHLSAHPWQFYKKLSDMDLGNESSSWKQFLCVWKFVLEQHQDCLKTLLPIL